MRLFSFVILILALPTSVLAQPVPTTSGTLGAAVRNFDEGNLHYREGDYGAAIRAYQRALDQGYASGALYYNLGNAYFRMDSLGQSIRYYEKARALIPDSPELAHNLQIARGRTVDRFSRLPEAFWRPIWRSVQNALGTGGLFAVGLLCYLAACAALAARIRSGPTPWRRRVLTAGAIAAVCFLTLAFAASTDVAERTRAVVLVDEVTPLEAPDGGRSDFRIHEGLVVDVVSESGFWLQVRLPNGARGWVGADVLGSI